MQADQFLVLGIILLGLAFPSLLNAYSQSRAPRLAMMLAVAGGILIVLAVRDRPSGYTLEEVPRVFARVFNELVG
ncbi:MAG: hypothetical protein R3D84_05215 [Paracoccaceae bacterium]